MPNLLSLSSEHSGPYFLFTLFQQTKNEILVCVCAGGGYPKHVHRNWD